jgi:hypothetical protein
VTASKGAVARPGVCQRKHAEPATLQHTRRGRRSARYTQAIVDVQMSTLACHKQTLAERLPAAAPGPHQATARQLDHAGSARPEVKQPVRSGEIDQPVPPSADGRTNKHLLARRRQSVAVVLHPAPSRASSGRSDGDSCHSAGLRECSWGCSGNAATCYAATVTMSSGLRGRRTVAGRVRRQARYQPRGSRSGIC